MGVPKLPRSHAKLRIAGYFWRSSLDPHFLWRRNRGARCFVGKGIVLASLGSTRPSARDDHRQDQAFGFTRVPGSLATGQETSTRATRVQDL